MGMHMKKGTFYYRVYYIVLHSTVIMSESVLYASAIYIYITIMTTINS